MRVHARSHVVTTAVLIALSGMITGVAAAGHVGPFSALGATTTQHTVAAQLPGATLPADSLFPVPTQPPAVHNVIVVTDPPREAAPTTAPSTTEPEPDSTPVPEPSDSPSPTPEPCDDDCGGDDGGGGGGGD